MGWCHLRQLSIHPELVGDLWCHHWTSRPPRLPLLSGGGTWGHGHQDAAIQQLSLDSLAIEN
jgi:hypothetical protein